MFTTAALGIVVKAYNIKNNKEFCYCFENGDSKTYKYHPDLVGYIVSLIAKNPNIVIELHKKR